MYRLMRSAKFTVVHPTLGPMSSYRQRLMGQYRQVGTALAACEKANASGGLRCYVLNDLGQGNYQGAWID
jgi:hypothetical protein